MRILKIIIVIFAITISSVIGFAIRNVVLNDKISSLEYELEQQQAIADRLRLEIDMTDTQSEQDVVFLSNMFDEIFTFYDMDDFNDARANAKSYGLSDDFIDSFYDTSELSNSIYAEAMLDVMCKYDSSELYLLDRDGDIGYYLAVVTLDTVKYNSSFRLGLFISLSDNGDMNQRIKSIVYYNIN